jgi:hypothetical protein
MIWLLLIPTCIIYIYDLYIINKWRKKLENLFFSIMFTMAKNVI